jgi:hypothetical protein
MIKKIQALLHAKKIKIKDAIATVKIQEIKGTRDVFCD